jgi:hypothetical protein
MAEQLNNIAGFAYLNVEVATLEATLAQQLRFALFPGGSGITNAQTLEMLTRGQVGVYVTAGDQIGKASAHNAPDGSRQVGFTVMTDCGPLEPSYAYNWMRAFVEDGQPTVDAFLNLAPKRWPLIDANLSSAEAIDLTSVSLYSFPVLQDLRRPPRSLNRHQWRGVGDNQKKLWRDRLLKRTGHALPDSTAPPFEFDDLDWQNIFQLEAVVEFYANYLDPWLAGAVPLERVNSTLEGSAATVTGRVVTLDGSPDLTGITVNRDELLLEQAEAPRVFQITAFNDNDKTVTLCESPTVTGGSSAWKLWSLNPNYVTVDFVQPEGATATVNGPLVTLAGCSNLQLVSPNQDTLRLENESNVASKTFRITSVDTVQKTVTVTGTPSLNPPDSPWRINLRPVLILIDPFGGRVGGKNATVESQTAQETVLKLNDHPAPPNLDRINGKFDSIYLPSDTARATRSYRINAADDTSKTVTLSGIPVLEGGSTAWHIQAGISGELPGVEGRLGTGGRGIDHYDGAMFLLYGGRLENRFRWTSYTSRSNTSRQVQSSIRGNRRYKFSSLKAVTKAFINLAFWVGNPQGVFEPLPGAFYFDGQAAFPNQLPAADANGKKAVMIHYGLPHATTDGTGSGGCLVSPNIYELRDLLIDFYQEEYRIFHNDQTDTDIGDLHGIGHEDSMAIYPGFSAAHWDNKIVGTLWLIRPDELPV